MTQAVFAAALLDPDSAVPMGVVDPEGRPAPKRFSVYRNNVAGSLTRALEAAFPTVRQLVGEEFFVAMAGVYLRAHPPMSRMLMLYGEGMPEFLEGFPPVASLGYLPDVARVDQAMRESYHAADSQPLPEGEFQRLIGEDIAGLRLRLAPSLRLVRSHWPVVAIWEANHEGGPPPRAGSEDALILRPEFDPRPHRLPEGGAGFVAALLQGATLGEAVEAAGAGLDLTALLGLLIQGRAITGVSA
ncbi:MAG: DNA-binding domain-containing protein [Tabrizicola sp.]